MSYIATKQKVKNRGIPPNSFLEELIAWGKTAPDELFAGLNAVDVYASIAHVMPSPLADLKYRRAVMLEVMRVLAGFESSWRWNAGRDITNPTSVTADTIEAGAWQVSANSMAFGDDLKELVKQRAGATDGETFQKVMKTDHTFAMEYIARLLRHTVKHNGPVKRHEIDEWLRQDAVKEFVALLG